VIRDPSTRRPLYRHYESEVPPWCTPEENVVRFTLRWTYCLTYVFDVTAILSRERFECADTEATARF